MNYFLGIDATTGVLVADFEDTATGGNHPVAGHDGDRSRATVWHHAAATYDGTTWRLYLDGKLEMRPRGRAASRRAATRSSTRPSGRR